MDMNFGGPVWHASIRTSGNQRDDLARRLALRALADVGDESLGQWEQGGRSAFHIRRRLSMREQIEAGLAMRDIRGTAEALQRIEDLLRVVPMMREFGMMEARL